MTSSSDICYSDERFADIQLLRYRLNGFERLSLAQKKYIYCLSQATLFGRDIIFDQQGKYNLAIRKLLETIVSNRSAVMDVSDDSQNFNALETYLKRIWFSNGIHHHYGCDKFEPGFPETWFREVALSVGCSVEMLDELCPVIFDPAILPKRVNKSDGDDLVLTSACNFYEGVTQAEAEAYYSAKKAASGDRSPSWGLNSRLVKHDDQILEEVYTTTGLYGPALKKIVYWLSKARTYAENDAQKDLISRLIEYYETGDLHTFDTYSIAWVNALEGQVDFINGFIEVYGDPLGFKATWEGLVEYIDAEATRRATLISSNAQWFEDHSPVDPRFRKKEVKGVSAKVICAAMLGGDEYPSTAIGINLPNADWIRAEHGSKSITISNITDAYSKVAKDNGFQKEFVIDAETLSLIEQYGDVCDNLHTDLHECLGHGSGQILPGVDPDALKAYGNTIEEARADLFGLYYIADPKLVELGLIPTTNAYKSNYYTYLMNGLLTQLVRITPGNQIEEAHMRNRSLIAHWCLANGNGVVSLVKGDNGKTYVHVSDYARLRHLFATLLAEVQRIKSEGDYAAARQLVEQYAVRVDATLHAEVLARYKTLNLAPYKGFINPLLTPVLDSSGKVVDIVPTYSETYSQQMMRYSREYSTLI